MHKILRTGMVLFLIIPGLTILTACAKKAAVVKKEPSIKAETADADRQKALAAERQKKEAEERRFRADKIQLVYEDVYFQKGSYRLQPEAFTILYRKADFLKKYPDVSVIIEGHTDEHGSRETNMAFGERRAGAVKSFLIKEGIDSSRLIAVSFGRERPVDTGRTEQAHAKNRRVHFVVKD